MSGRKSGRLQVQLSAQWHLQPRASNARRSALRTVGGMASIQTNGSVDRAALAGVSAVLAVLRETLDAFEEGRLTPDEVAASVYEELGELFDRAACVVDGEVAAGLCGALGRWLAHWMAVWDGDDDANDSLVRKVAEDLDSAVNWARGDPKVLAGAASHVLWVLDVIVLGSPEDIAEGKEFGGLVSATAAAIARNAA
jgi:hypothetical protein